MQTYTCEDCLEILSGFSSIKILSPPSLKTEHSKLIPSLARQVFRGTPLTDRQYELATTKLKEYTKVFEKNDIDLYNSIKNLRYPLREIDRSHYLRFETIDNKIMLVIRFLFNKKIIKELEEITKLAKEDDVSYKSDKKYYFTPKETYIFELVNLAKRFTTKFDIDKDVLEIYEELLLLEENKDQYVPGVYDYQLKNVPIEVVDYMTEKFSDPRENLHLYYDRRHLFGLKHFELQNVDKSLFNLSELAKKIAKRDVGQVSISSAKYNLNDLFTALYELDRFPLLVSLDEKDALDNLSALHKVTKNFIDTKDISVMFRFDNIDYPEFNEYVKYQNLNNPVAKTTKIVYINSRKLPKPLVTNDDWKPCTSLALATSIHSKTTAFWAGLDLQVTYNDDFVKGVSWSYGSKVRMGIID